MAIQYLHDLNLNYNELQNAKLHVTGTAPTASVGVIYYDSTNNVIKYRDNAGWKTISSDTTDDNKFITSLSFNTSSGVLTATFNDSSTTTVDLDGKYAESSHTHAASDITSGTFVDARIPDLNASKITAGTFATGRIPSLATSKITSGTFANARISSGSVTQHEGDIDHDALTNFVANEHIDWTADYSATDQIDAANIPSLAASIITSGTLSADRIPNLNASKITAGTLGTARIPNLSTDKLTSGILPVARGGTGSATLAGAGIVLTTGAQSIGGNKTFNNNVIVTGNLTVNGTTTSVNSNTVNIGDNIIVLNSDETGTPSQSAGFEIERGTSDNVRFIWDEGNSRFTAEAYSESSWGAANLLVDTLTATTLSVTNYGLSADDIPNLAATKITSGTFDAARIPTLAIGSKTSGTLAVSRGGTNATSFADKSVIVSQDSGTDTLAAKAMTTNGSLLIGGSSGPEVATLTAGSNVTITNANNSITIASSVSTSDIDTQIDARSSAHTITGDGNDVEFTITYGFTAAATNDVMVQVVDSSGDHDGDTVFAEVERHSTTQCKVKFGSAPANNKTYRVLCFKIA